MKNKEFKSKIFLDSGDPSETKEAIKLLGFLDGQTTNPTLVSRHPEVVNRLHSGKKFTKEEIFAFYKDIVKEISSLIPLGSVSIEVYADGSTSAEEMLEQARKFYLWIPNAHIKFPIISNGLKAAEQAIKEGMRVNMTLCFSQAQAAAVHAIAKDVKKGQVFLSPFVGRLDDIGENGMTLVRNIIRMYRQAKSPVEVLTASVRRLEHLLYAVSLSSDIITAPIKILKEWAGESPQIPSEDYVYSPSGLAQIFYADFDLNKSGDSFDLKHSLTDAGIKKFTTDWNALLQ